MRPALAALLLTLVAPSLAHADPVTLRLATIAPTGTGWAREFSAWGRDIEAGTHGNVRVKIYFSAIGGDEFTVLDRIKREQLDGAIGSESCVRLGPSLKVTRIFGLFQSREESFYILGRLLPKLDQEFLRNGFVNLGEATLGPELLFTREPVRDMAELRKTLLWVWEDDAELRTQAPALGLRVVATPLDGGARAYDDKSVDGFIAMPTAALAFQWSTQAKYLTNLDLSYRNGCVFVASRAFDALVDRVAALRARGDGEAAPAARRSDAAPGRRAHQRPVRAAGPEDDSRVGCLPPRLLQPGARDPRAGRAEAGVAEAARRDLVVAGGLSRRAPAVLRDAPLSHRDRAFLDGAGTVCARLSSPRHGAQHGGDADVGGGVRRSGVACSRQGAATTNPDAGVNFQADAPAVYVAKVKNILVGLPPTDDEVAAVTADPSALGGLVDGWMQLPEYQREDDGVLRARLSADADHRRRLHRHDPAAGARLRRTDPGAAAERQGELRAHGAGARGERAAHHRRVHDQADHDDAGAHGAVRVPRHAPRRRQRQDHRRLHQGQSER